MKKIVYFALVFLGVGFVQVGKAQVNVSVNIGSQPLWGPVGHAYAHYYYMPEIDVYYDVIHRRYTYYQGNRWITKSKLPGRYKKFNLYRTYKVVLNDRNPWQYHRTHRNSYSRYANNYSQVVLRDARRDREYRRGDDRRLDRGYDTKKNYHKKKNKHNNGRGNRR
ncbi:hypothetical protein FAZ19_18715 [Sphingobacterium alkalisoli]|uniref:Uncharacterized protein n=1 Tax=Sphingobacterium alkalisoli TaxID=1874115 RepID=A0A4U0GWU3_9SPHI|nr:hypothetical protein [Sphingobacterium alkalisoli]TJY63605.1 hypothetical protein FAZ19_18715 [Sphingobacterium alkalisoli]GGH27120.1 hypothetical protein GCM10011418_36850 [Sphingobacterium alkalisoli]